MEVAKRLEGIGEYYFSQKLREIDDLNKAGKNIINLGIGSPDLPPHPEVIKALNEESVKTNVHAYQSYKGSPVLRNAIAEWYKKWYDVDLDAATEILPLIGSKEGIMHICMTYLNEGDAVLIPNPGYPTYTSAVKLAGGVPVYYSLDDLQNLNIPKAKLMFVNFPHMPTGKSLTAEGAERLIKFAKANNVLIIHDNPYSFILNDQPRSMLTAESAEEVVIELNSLSKSHNMAGWRIGMMCAKKERIEEVLRFKSNMDSGMFLPVQLAAAKALSLGKEWHDEVNSIYKKRRDGVLKLLDILNCKYDTAQAGMFVWAAIPSNFNDGYALSDEVLYKSNVFITPGGIFGSEGEKYVRVSLCTPIEKIEEAVMRIGVRGS